MKRTIPLISLMVAFSLLFGACGSSAENEALIATSVALTVQAQNAPLSVPGSLNSATPQTDLTAVPTLTPAFTPTITGQPSSYTNCMAASLLEENPPDLAIFKPGATFFKTWRIQNNSNCVWNPSYRIIFWSGDQMGGAFYYNFPQTVPPGQSADVTLLLTAPETAGEYKSEWKFQTPDTQNFGVGQYSNPVYAQIVVSADEKPAYGVTAVTYELNRNPQKGCPGANVFFTVTATVSFSGPMKEVILQFQHSDGYKASKIKLAVTEAGTMAFTDEWSFHRDATPGVKWIRLTQVFPTYVVYDEMQFSYECN